MAAELVILALGRTAVVAGAPLPADLQGSLRADEPAPDLAGLIKWVKFT